MISIPFYPMQLSDVHDLLMLNPRVPLMLIDKPRLDSRRARTFDVDRIDVAGKFHFVGTDAESLERDLVARRLERLQRLKDPRPHDAPQRSLAMYRAEPRRVLLKFLFRNSGCR